MNATADAPEYTASNPAEYPVSDPAENTASGIPEYPASNPAESVVSGTVEYTAGEPYRFCGENYMTRAELVPALIRNWQDGKEHLFHGKLSAYYRTCDHEAEQICLAAEKAAEMAADNPAQQDRIFWRAMYLLAPEIRSFFWQGRIFSGLPDLGWAILNGLRSHDPEMELFLDSMLQDNILSSYAEQMQLGENQQRVFTVLENTHQAYQPGSREQIVNGYIIGFLLSGQRTLRLNGREYRDTEELTGFIHNLPNGTVESFRRFRAFCHMLIDEQNQPDPQLEAWLKVQGRQDALTVWRENLQTV